MKQPREQEYTWEIVFEDLGRLEDFTASLSGHDIHQEEVDVAHEDTNDLGQGEAFEQQLDNHMQSACKSDQREQYRPSER